MEFANVVDDVLLVVLNRICLLLVHLYGHMAEFNVKVDTKGICALFLVDRDVDGLDWVYQLYALRLFRAIEIALFQSTLWMTRSSKSLLKWHTIVALKLEQ